MKTRIISAAVGIAVFFAAVFAAIKINGIILDILLMIVGAVGVYEALVPTKYLKSIYYNDKQNTILEDYGNFSKNYEYLDLSDSIKPIYFEKVVLRDERFIEEIRKDLKSKIDGKDLTEDEIAYIRYILGDYDYEDYVDVCEIEECEPLERL